MLKPLFVFGLLLSFLSAIGQEDSLHQNPSSRVNRAVVFYGDHSKEDSTNTEIKPIGDQIGRLDIIEEDSLGMLIDGYREQKRIQGYKVQLYSGRSRMEAVKIKSNFLKKYGDEEGAEIIYQQPNFKIRVGNFRDRLIANKWLIEYKADFPSSFIVKDEILITYD